MSEITDNQNRYGQNLRAVYPNMNTAPIAVNHKKAGFIERNKTELGLGIGLTALGILGVAAILKSKPNRVKQFTQKIEFKEASNMEEAKKFAKENFGIELDVGDQIFTANLVNDMCAQISNRMNGKLALPKKIKLENFDETAGSFGIDNNIICLDTNAMGGRYITSQGQEVEFQKYANDFINRGEKTYSQIVKEWENDTQYPVMNRVIRSMKRTIAHEIGHCNHFAILPIGSSVGNSERTIKILHDKLDKPEVKKACEEFFENDDYYRKNYYEFVAETFALKALGKKAPKEIEEIYRSYFGPKI